MGTTYEQRKRHAHGNRMMLAARRAGRRVGAVFALPRRDTRLRCRRRESVAAYPGRHSYASLLIHEGRSLPFVAASMGHSSATTTLEHYSHAFEVARHGTAVKMVDAIHEARRVCAKRAQPASLGVSARPRRAPETA